MVEKQNKEEFYELIDIFEVVDINLPTVVEDITDELLAPIAEEKEEEVLIIDVAPTWLADKIKIDELEVKQEILKNIKKEKKSQGGFKEKLLKYKKQMTDEEKNSKKIFIIGTVILLVIIILYLIFTNLPA